MQRLQKYLKDVVFFELEHDMDKLMVVSGEPGSGKSNLVIQIAREYAKISGTKFSPRNNLCYNREQLENLAYNLPANSIIWLDESAEAAYNRLAMDMDQIDLCQFFMTNRALNKFYVWCIPKFRRLDKVFREDNVSTWIDVRFEDRASMERGLFYLSERGEYDQFTEDVWNLKDKEAHQEYNLAGEDTFSKAPTKIWNSYMRFKMQFLEDRRKKKRHSDFLRLLYWCNKTKKIPQRELALALDTSLGNINSKITLFGAKHESI